MSYTSVWRVICMRVSLLISPSVCAVERRWEHILAGWVKPTLMDSSKCVCGFMESNEVCKPLGGSFFWLRFVMKSRRAPVMLSPCLPSGNSVCVNSRGCLRVAGISGSEVGLIAFSTVCRTAMTHIVMWHCQIEKSKEMHDGYSKCQKKTILLFHTSEESWLFSPHSLNQTLLKFLFCGNLCTLLQ